MKTKANEPLTLPQEVQDKMKELGQMDQQALVAEVSDWSLIRQRWAVVCRSKTYSHRTEYVSDGIESLCLYYSQAVTEIGETFFVAIWCMPDQFLDNVIDAYDLLQVTEEQESEEYAR